MTMISCKHDWHFVHGTSTLKCERCGAETGPTSPEQLAQDMFKDFEPWTTEQVAVPTGQMHTFDARPNYNITFHRGGQEIGKLDFNGPEMVFTGDAAESAKVFIDWVATAFHGRLEKEREAGRQEAQEVTWGVDWGRAGNKSCATIIKRLPGGRVEVVAVEYEP